MADKKTRRCHSCRKTMECHKKDYHYTESGLDNVFLKGINVFTCKCGEEILSIPAMPNLHNTIGKSLINKKEILSAKEIRYLRKNMGLTAQALSKMMGIDNATISRWEHNSQSISKSHDRFLRLIYSNLMDLPIESSKHLIEESFEKISTKTKKASRLIIPPKEWAEASSCELRC